MTKRDYKKEFTIDMLSAVEKPARYTGGEFGSVGDSDCSGAIADFFNIVKKNKHGFRPGKTSDARKQFLMECSGAQENTAAVNRVISMFGRVKG